jgi:hypothetical protein
MTDEANNSFNRTASGAGTTENKRNGRRPLLLIRCRPILRTHQSRQNCVGEWKKIASGFEYLHQANRKLP